MRKLIISIGMLMTGAVCGYAQDAPEEQKDILVIEHNDKWVSPTDYKANIAKAENGDPVAQRMVARSYMTGIGVPQDYAEAWKWMGRSAGSGDREAQYQFGLMYRDGKGVKRNATEAAYWFRRAARNGHPEALLNLGKAFEKGAGVLPDRKIAAQNYWRAGENGNAEGSYLYACMLRAGDAVPQDLTGALKYFKQAVTQGYASAQADVDALEARGIKYPVKKAVKPSSAASKQTAKSEAKSKQTKAKAGSLHGSKSKAKKTSKNKKKRR